MTHVVYDPTFKGSPRWLGHAVEGGQQVHIELFREHIRFLNHHLNLQVGDKPGQVYNVNRSVILWHQDMHMPRLFGLYNEEGDFVNVNDEPQPAATPPQIIAAAPTTHDMDAAVFTDDNTPENAPESDSAQVLDKLRQTKLFSDTHDNLSAFGLGDES